MFKGNEYSVFEEEDEVDSQNSSEKSQKASVVAPLQLNSAELI